MIPYILITYSPSISKRDKTTLSRYPEFTLSTFDDPKLSFDKLLSGLMKIVILILLKKALLMILIILLEIKIW